MRSVVLPTHLNLYEVLAELAPFASSYLEIGTHEGKSLMSVLAANPSIARVACCDTWILRQSRGKPSGSAHVLKQVGDAGWDGQLTIHEGSSRDTVPKINERFDLTLVDGDHTEDAAYVDLLNVWPMTRKAMVVHDLRLCPPVWLAVQRFLDEIKPGEMSLALVSYWQATLVCYRLGGAPA